MLSNQQGQSIEIKVETIKVSDIYRDSIEEWFIREGGIFE